MSKSVIKRCIFPFFYVVVGLLGLSGAISPFPPIPLESQLSTLTGKIIKDVSEENSGIYFYNDSNFPYKLCKKMWFPTERISSTEKKLAIIRILDEDLTERERQHYCLTIYGLSIESKEIVLLNHARSIRQKTSLAYNVVNFILIVIGIFGFYKAFKSNSM